MDLIKRLAKLVVAAAIIGVAINDGGRYVQAMYWLDTATQNAAHASAASYGKQKDRTASWQAGEDRAENYGATVYGFDIANNSVHVWTRLPIHGTWVVQPVAAALDRKPLATPPSIESDDIAVIQ